MANKRIVLFPFLAQGHLIPFLSFAKLISQRHSTFSITLINTPLNIQKLRAKLPPNSLVELRELPFSSSDHGLPPNIETTESLPLHLYLNFFTATETLKTSFENLISELIDKHGCSNLCIIADMFLGWTVEGANRLGVSHSVFVTSGAYASAIFFSLWLNPPENFASSEEDELALVDFPEISIPQSMILNTVIPTNGTDPFAIFLQRQLSLSFKSSSFLVNTVEEFETEGLSLLRRSSQLPVWCVGPLACLPSSSPVHDSNYCIKWLNSRTPASVLYISFGSQNSIPASQMMQLAKGLEASGKSFIWVIRPPLEFAMNEEWRPEWLPGEFEERMKERNQGILVHKWAPQLEILSNESTVAFLSHCGWNSVVESLSQGVPIIGWPIIGDQMFNSKMLEEVGVCVEIARGMKRGWEEVAKAIELVMGGTNKGFEMRVKANEIKEMMRRALREDEGNAGSSVKAVKDFLQTAFSTKTMMN
ncbi:uncharacterized protein A4U43_C10F18590 [Asparagus officinalis]|uniref:Glycosyltransferase n=1 Tax=Asparagus officinalis TaxID=4686 RepID=A0A5P1E3U3_ASPOF|nr:UDP-glycosyltransferase 92A1-like [Asparagus officinalis]ONK57294.1 uncharacterized protein A4U43_C10F18590 [Asparagus officinalis]